MFDKATSGLEPNNDRFSVCSKNSIKKNVNRVRSKQGSTCFIKSDDPICGNKIVEKGEQCDCGDANTCTEECCNPAGSNNQCKLRIEKICSPSQGLCHYKINFYLACYSVRINWPFQPETTVVTSVLIIWKINKILIDHPPIGFFSLGHWNQRMKQILQMNTTWLKIPTGRRRTRHWNH